MGMGNWKWIGDGRLMMMENGSRIGWIRELVLEEGRC